MKVLLIGATGQLGTDLQKTNPGHELMALPRAQGDITDVSQMAEKVRLQGPDVVINAAAFNRTEDCEDFPEKAFAVNTVGPGRLAKICGERGIPLVHYSSDYVFDGHKGQPYREEDRPAPLSVYGLSKLGGECLVTAASDKHLVIRCSSLFGAAGSSGKGGNFVETIVKRAREGLSAEVVEDIIMTPTYTLDLAVATWTLLERNVPGGLWHISNSGPCSWYQFAQEIFSLLRCTSPLKPIHASDRPSKMKRPLYSALACDRLRSLGIAPPRPWPEALQAYLIEKGHLPKSFQKETSGKKK